MKSRFTAHLVLFLFLLLAPLSAFPAAVGARPLGRDFRIPILLYHRFGTTVADWMTITTPVFESHLRYLKENGYQVIPLRRLIDFYQGKAAAPPPRSAVITVDDGHKTVFSHMLPLVRKYKVPVTLFIYPSAISNAKYAMTWDQLRELKKTGYPVPYLLAPKFRQGEKKTQARGIRRIRRYAAGEIQSQAGEGSGGKGGPSCLALRRDSGTISG